MAKGINYLRSSDRTRIYGQSYVPKPRLRGKLRYLVTHPEQIFISNLTKVVSLVSLHSTYWMHPSALPATMVAPNVMKLALAVKVCREHSDGDIDFELRKTHKASYAN